MHPIQLTRTIEECSLKAWPAIEQEERDGWLLRFARGYTRRANSVVPLHPGNEEPLERIALCEEIYAGRGLPCVFKITPLSHPAALDPMLASRGYRKEGLTSVRLLEPLPAEDGGAADCALPGALSAAWFGAFTTLDGTPPGHREALREILARIAPPNTGALLRVEGRPVCCGRAVYCGGAGAEGEQVGLYDIVTETASRGRGHARRLIGRLLEWGRAQGARRAYLQVEADNGPALRLYDKLGFREIYRYWYRVL